ncbi:DUF4158 domain-containing protein (plasmid) [Streptomyces atratus]|uniref:DUF4158 domain-containing protein n=1 Tax=Streptomyces atratus TaxID=1893 RepID=UPI002F90BAB5
MPVEFLSDDQAASYGKFNEEPTRPELERFFYLDDEDRKLIAKRRGDHNRLGFALQMCTVRFIGRCLPDDPLDVPWVVIEHIAEQLGIEDVSCVKAYTERKPTAYEHAWEIRDAYEYHEYDDPEWVRKFRTFLHGRAWTAHSEGPKALFDYAVGWLRKNRVLLPGVSVLARQVSEVRTIADKRLHTTVAKAAWRADPSLPADLVALLETPKGRRYSYLETFRRPPTKTTGTAMKRALERVDEIAVYRLGRVKLDKLPPNRLAALARYGLGSKATSLERASEPKRTAMLTAVMRHMEAKAIDDALELFTVLMSTKLLSTAKRLTNKDRLSTLPQLEKASRIAARMSKCSWRSWSTSRRAARRWTRPRCGRPWRRSRRGPSCGARPPRWRAWSRRTTTRRRSRSARRWPTATTRCARSCRCSATPRCSARPRPGSGSWPRSRACPRSAGAR